MRLKQLAAVASLGLIISCSSDKSGGPTGLSGQLSFTYSGAVSGTFNVTGEMPVSGTSQETQSWAAGEVVTSGADPGTFVVAATPRTAGSTHDVVVVQANRTNAGTSNIDFDNCVDGSTNVCSTVIFLVGAQNGSGSGFLQICTVLTGSIVITEITSTRIRGTFSGAGECSTPTGTVTAFTVTNGSFDVAIVPGVS